MKTITTPFSPDSTISNNCILLPNSFFGYDSKLDKFAHLATNFVIGASLHVCSNSTVREKVKISDFSLVGAGSVVLNDVPRNSEVMFNPARLLKERG